MIPLHFCCCPHCNQCALLVCRCHKRYCERWRCLCQTRQMHLSHVFVFNVWLMHVTLRQPYSCSHASWPICHGYKFRLEPCEISFPFKFCGKFSVCRALAAENVVRLDLIFSLLKLIKQSVASKRQQHQPTEWRLYIKEFSGRTLNACPQSRKRTIMF